MKISRLGGNYSRERYQDMLSPLDGVLKRLGLSRPELSLLADINEGQIARVASGVVPTIPRRIKATLKDLGVDVRVLEGEHRTWREAKAIELRKTVLARQELERKQETAR